MAYPDPEIISPAVLHDMLDNPLDYPWRAHGIGMLRCYLDAAQHWRVNLWHRRLLNLGISTMHTHPWAFRSFIVAGRMKNTRWTRSARGPNTQEFHHGRVGCGVLPFEGVAEASSTIHLSPMMPETYVPGTAYDQTPLEIHTTEADNGSISIMHRTHYQEGGEADVFWPVGTPWGDASRDATREDILVTAEAAKAMLQRTIWKKD